METSLMTGAYTAFNSKISDDEKQIFERATQGLHGVNYQPIAVATQVVAGTNYKFFCNTKVTALKAITQPAMITIFQPLKGEEHISSIELCK